MKSVCLHHKKDLNIIIMKPEGQHFKLRILWEVFTLWVIFPVSPAFLYSVLVHIVSNCKKGIQLSE